MARMSTALQTTVATKAVVTTTHEVKIQPALRKKLLANLRAYVDLAGQKKAITEAMTAHSASVEEALEKIGEDKIELEGLRATTVRGQHTVWDEIALREAGVTPAQIAAGKITKPKKPYVRISGAEESE
jgi:hypothetical protein